MRDTIGLKSICCLGVMACSTAVAQDAPTTQAQQVETLQEQIQSARDALHTERERTQELEARLACTEELLQGYDACGEKHELESPSYWDCVQSTLAGHHDCKGARVEGEASEKSDWGIVNSE